MRSGSSWTEAGQAERVSDEFEALYEEASGRGAWRAVVPRCDSTIDRSASGDRSSPRARAGSSKPRCPRRGLPRCGPAKRDQGEGEGRACPVCRAVADEPIEVKPVTVTDATFPAEVERSPVPVLLDMRAPPWRGRDRPGARGLLASGRGRSDGRLTIDVARPQALEVQSGRSCPETSVGPIGGSAPAAGSSRMMLERPKRSRRYNEATSIRPDRPRGPDHRPGDLVPRRRRPIVDDRSCDWASISA